MDYNPKRILFVCLGNICRSPAADGVLRYKADEAELDIEIDSCGIGGWHIGNLPDSRMRECGAGHGYDFSHHARQITTSDFADFDYIIGMDAQNLEDLRALAPSADAKAKIRCLASYLTEHEDQDFIPDPYYGSEADFEYALELIEDATDTIVDRLSAGKPL